MTGPSHAARIPVKLAPTSASRYEVMIGTQLIEQLGPLAADALGGPIRRAMIFADGNVPERFILAAARSLAPAEVAVHELTATERHKSIETLGACLAQLAATRHERTDPVIAIGGGIVGDIAGFAAAAYRRGTPVIQAPTTLLAMVDASVGGKTGVNLRAPGDGALLKNMAGAFHQPALVLADLDTLASLEPREFRCGIAECIKHGLIAGGLGEPGLIDWIRAHAGAIAARDAAVLKDLVTRNVALKAEVVAADQFETAASKDGGRALLNLGHTFGHAIETLPQLSPTDDPAAAPLLHGEAVSLGLVAANAAAEAAGLLPSGQADETRALLDTVGLPTAVRGLPPTASVIERMVHDKKAVGGRLRIVLPIEGRAARVVEDPDAAWLGAGIDAIRRP